MKKFTYLLAVAAVFTACNSGNNGYTVTGTVEGAADGDTVYLETVEGRQFVKLDSAVIKDGTFTFKGHKILLSTATSPTKPKEKTAQPSTSSWKTARLKSTCRRKTTLPPVLPTMMPTRKSEPKSTV